MDSPQALPLVKFNEIHIDEDCSNSLAGTTHEKELFHGCTFKDVKNATLKQCTLAHNKVVTDKIEDALGLTVTMDCKTFDDLELSPLMFDLFMVLLLKTKGNDAKRRRIMDILGRERLHQLLTEMKQLDS